MCSSKKGWGEGEGVRRLLLQNQVGGMENRRGGTGVESKKAAIKAHNKDNDRRETQDLSRRLT